MVAWGLIGTVPLAASVVALLAALVTVHRQLKRML